MKRRSKPKRLHRKMPGRIEESDTRSLWDQLRGTLCDPGVDPSARFALAYRLAVSCARPVGLPDDFEVRPLWRS